MKNNKLKVLVAGASAISMLSNVTLASSVVHAQDENKGVSITQLSAVDDLKQKIEDLKIKIEDKKIQLEEAKGNLNQASSNVKNQQVTYDKAKAEALEAEIKADKAIILGLEFQIENIKSKKVALENAKEEYSKLEATLGTKNELLPEAEKAVKEAEANLEQAIKDAEVATPEALENAQAKVEENRVALEEANKALENAQGDVNKAQADLNKAKDDLVKAEADVVELEGNLESASKEVEDAQASYDEALVIYEGATNPEVKEQAEKDLEKAKSALEEANKKYSLVEEEYEKAKEVTKKAGEEYYKAQDELKEKQGLEKEAQTVLDNANSELNKVKEDLATAQADYEKLVSEKAELERVVQAKEEALESAKANSNDILASYEQAKQETLKAKATFDEATLNLALANEKYRQGSKGFFESIGAEQAVKYLTPQDAIEEEMYKYTKLGAEGDATNLKNMKKSIEFMKECNRIRKSLGLSELKVTAEMMAAAQQQVNWTAGRSAAGGTTGHSGLFNVGENLEFGLGEDMAPNYNPFDAWYDKEKKNYEDLLERDPSMEGKTFEEIIKVYPELKNKIGHYFNIIKEDYVYQGFAINNKVEIEGSSMGNPVVYSNTFDKVKNISFVNGTAYTIDEFEAIFDEYYNKVVNAQDVYDDALKAYNSALGRESELLEDYNESLVGVTNAESEVAKAKENVTAKDSEISVASGVVSEKEGIVSQHQEKVNKAQADLDLAKGEVVKAQEVLDEKGDAYDIAGALEDTKKEELDRARNKVAEEKVNVADKEAILDKINEGVETALDNLEKAEVVLTTAKGKYELVSEMLDTTKVKVETLKANIVSFEKDLQEKQGNLELANSNVELAKTNLKEAESKLKELNDLIALVGEAESKLAVAEDSRDTLLIEIENLNNGLAKLSSTISDLEKEIEEGNLVLGQIQDIKLVFDYIKDGVIAVPLSVDTNELMSLVTKFKEATILANDELTFLNNLKVVESEKESIYNEINEEYNLLVSELSRLEGELANMIKPWTPLEPAKPIDKGNSGNEGTSDNGNNTNSSTSPKTGDASMLGTYGVMLGGSLVAMVSVARKKKVRK